MPKNFYLIMASYGEWDDFNRFPMFSCNSEDEACLFVDALEKHEQPYWNNVIKFFEKHFGYIPEDLGFSWETVEILTLND